MIDGFRGNGIVVNGNNNKIVGSYIGTDVTGKAASNGNAGAGIRVQGANNIIGGTTAADRNIISGNQGLPLGPTGAHSAGVFITGSGATSNVVEGNFIGTDVMGAKPLPNDGDGIEINNGAGGNMIGGSTTGAGNLISGNNDTSPNFVGAGVFIGGFGGGNTVQGNMIGTNATGTAGIPNTGSGVFITDSSSGNLIGGTTSGAGNIIADNLGFGVSLSAPASNNVVLSNSIFSNQSPGISIGPGVSVPAAPSLTLAQAFKTFTEIQGTYAGAPSTTYLLEFFDNDARDPSGFGQGKRLVASANVTIDAAGDPASFDLTNVPPLPIGHAITATATELQLVYISPNFVLSPLVTSGFSASAAVVGAFQVLNTADSGFGSLRQAIVNSNQEPGPDTITFAIPGAGLHTISPASPLPTITDQVNLDGTTERTFLGLPAAGPPVIQLNGNGLPGDGLVLGFRPAGASVSGTSSAGSTIIGLDIYNFTGGAGIHIQTNGNLVTGDFLGTDVNGTAAGPGNGTGVVIDSGASNNTIGGTGAGAGNVISGNSVDGIEIIGSGVTGNVVQGNFIGTNAAGTAALGNGYGVTIDSGASKQHDRRDGSRRGQRDLGQQRRRHPDR